jgi:hypothetical protein
VFDCDVMLPGVFSLFFQNMGHAHTLADLGADPLNDGGKLPLLAMALERHGRLQVLPAPDTVLQPGDRILFVGEQQAMPQQARFALEPGLLTAQCTGLEPPRSWVFRWLAHKGWYQRNVHHKHPSDGS